MDEYEHELPMTEQESLLIIQQMISTAKQEQKDDGKGWIIWGWMLFITSLATAAGLYFHWLHTFFFWNIFGLLTLVLLVFDLVKKLFVKGTPRVKTYTQSLFQKLNAGFFIFLIFIITSMNIGVGLIMGFSLLIGLYGFWILIYGAVLDFKPSLIAAFVTWAIGFASLLQTSALAVMLLHAAAVLAGYIIPGHIAYKNFRKPANRPTLL